MCYSSLNDNVFQLLFWGTSSPRPLTGAPPLDPARGLPSPYPLACAVLKFPLKIPWWIGQLTLKCLCKLTAVEIGMRRASQSRENT